MARTREERARSLFNQAQCAEVRSLNRCPPDVCVLQPECPRRAVSNEIFSLEQQRKHINALFNTVPPGHGHAKLKVVFPDGTVSFVMAARVNDNWMLQGDVNFAIPDRRLGAKVESIWSW